MIPERVFNLIRNPFNSCWWLVQIADESSQVDPPINVKATTVTTGIIVNLFASVSKFDFVFEPGHCSRSVDRRGACSNSAYTACHSPKIMC